MNLLVIGGGGREHALAWKLAQSSKAQHVFVAPGNGGTARDPRLKNLAITDPVALADFALANKVVLTVVGPEAPLSAGVVDVFRARGLRIFGPTKAAAQLESSKAFSKAFMRRHGIPTAAYDTFSDPVAAHAGALRVCQCVWDGSEMGQQMISTNKSVIFSQCHVILHRHSKTKTLSRVFDICFHVFNPNQNKNSGSSIRDDLFMFSRKLWKLCSQPSLFSSPAILFQYKCDNLGPHWHQSRAL